MKSVLGDVLASVISSVADLMKGIITLFVIVDPLGNVPIFISLTERMSRDEKHKAFHTATFTGLILLLSFAVAGQQMLNFFGITVHSFMIAGGILLLIISVRLLISGGWQEQAFSPESIGAVPIACPLLVGPGAITTTVLNIQTMGIVITTASVLIVFAIVWLTLRFIDPIYRFLGRVGSLVIARVMAMFIAAIAIQYILEGITHVLIL